MFIDANWDLDFGAMITAHAEIKDRTSGVTTEDFRKMLVLHTKEHGWLVWKPWELDVGSGADMEDEKGVMVGRENEDEVEDGEGNEEKRERQREARLLRRKMNAIRVSVDSSCYVTTIHTKPIPLRSLLTVPKTLSLPSSFSHPEW